MSDRKQAQPTANDFAEDKSAPTGAEHTERHFAPVASQATGKYNLACATNALNNVLNLRAVPGLDKETLMAEFEAQLTEILDASAVAPDAWNKLVTRDQQEPGQTYESRTA